MAAEPEEGDRTLPPAAEQVHLPDPSYVPVVVALGLTIAVVGVVLSWLIFAIGALIVVIATLRWVRMTRSEMAELPLEH